MQKRQEMPDDMDLGAMDWGKELRDFFVNEIAAGISKSREQRARVLRGY